MKSYEKQMADFLNRNDKYSSVELIGDRDHIKNTIANACELAQIGEYESHYGVGLSSTLISCLPGEWRFREGDLLQYVDDLFEPLLKACFLSNDWEQFIGINEAYGACKMLVMGLEADRRQNEKAVDLAQGNPAKTAKAEERYLEIREMLKQGMSVGDIERIQGSRSVMTRYYKWEGQQSPGKKN